MAARGVIYDLAGEQQLLQQIAMGNETAFKLIFETYRSRVFTFVVNFIHSTADAEEIVQDTFLSLWQNRDSLVKVEHPRNYIYTVVRNKTLRYLSNVARDEKMLKVVWANMQVEVNPTEEALLMRESRALIDKALSTLPAQKQQVFRMCREEGMSHEDIALEMGLSKSRIKNIMVEVLRYIKIFLNQNSAIPAIILAFYLFFIK
ncbi:RNA polymerase sigma factor [Pedobacter heparinus]|uniref:RNA polymerase sigma-70 factor n=1 Tax=Pedobacter heparinus (strain ATCC 13125 / DSM 2366 / CIP 104194 / JCM 7457 / NBRC 12017 / NCIMB 9290 / NRRL B-14731 / HIM 762-3) TaxID=485917 RepID=C6XZ46_PEDHD|nr:RNA polymerase sigma-70 factor [Pedobacter heparinus]ACU02528.1 RNA polymerase sigma-70 factor [Pedobacter heparinus DSM 2366]